MAAAPPEHKPVSVVWREWTRRGERLCTVCDREGRGCLYGIDRLCFDDAARAMKVEMACPAQFEGGPGVAHGGWVAAVLDEVLGQLAAEYAGPVVTARLTIDYRRPVAIEQPLLGRSRWLGREGRKIRVAGEVCAVINASEVVLAEANGLFVTIDEDHHRRHAEWLVAQEKGSS